MVIAAAVTAATAAVLVATAAAVTAPGCVAAEVTVGAARTEMWLPLVEGKRVALLSNHTGMASDSLHTLDLMLAEGVNVTTLFSPEHGFRGTADAGEHVKSSVDAATGIPIASMYDGKSRSPAADVMARFDVLAVDLQDVGARFYTYHITMLDLMAACAAAGKPVIVFDRPNPLGMVTDGPVLDMRCASGVGRIPVPLIHGMTMGELALMANGEGWLPRGLRADLTVIPAGGYTHATRYVLPVAPSPNLRTMQAIYLYPSLCLFEGTPVSVGRGTDAPFTMYGSPMTSGPHTFTPQPKPGARHPMHEGRLCRGRNLADIPPDSIIAAGFDPQYIIDAFRSSGLAADRFFKPFFTSLAGTPALARMIAEGRTAGEIRRTWQAEVDSFIARRRPYLLYPETESE